MEAWQIVTRIGRGIYRRRKLMALAIFSVSALVLGTVVYLKFSQTPRYQTSATIVLKGSADQIPLFEEWTPKRPIYVQMAILQSRSLAESVLSSLPKAAIDELIRNRYHRDYQLELTNVYRRLTGQEPIIYSPQRIALDELQNARISFRTVREGLVTITAEASDARVAMDLVNTYIEVLLARTRSINIEDARTAREYLDQQLNDIKKSLKASEDTLANFTRSRGGVRIPEQSRTAVTRLSTIEAQLAEVQAEKKMAQTRLTALKQKLESQKPTQAPAQTTEPQPAARPAAPQPNIPRLQAHLSQLEGQLLELSAKYTDEHPRVILVKDRINELQRQIAATLKETTPVNPAPGAVASSDRASFANAILALEASVVTLGAQEEALTNQTAILTKNLSGLTGDEYEYSRLGRELESNQRLFALVSEKLNGVRIREQGEMQQVKVIDPPNLPTPAPANNSFALFGMTAMISLAIGLGIPALIEYTTMPVEREDDVIRTTHLPILGEIPLLRKTGQASTVPGVIPLMWSRRPALPDRTNGSSKNGQQDAMAFFVESFRRLRSSLQLATMENHVKTVLVLSAYDQEGKSTILSNIGMAFWEIGKKVILADADFYRPTLHKSLKVSAHAGLVDLLNGKTSLQNSIVPVAEGLWVSTRGSSLPAQGRGMLTSGRLREVIDEMAQEADLVFFDASPLMMVPDVLFLAAAVDAVILVAKAGETQLKTIAKSKEMLDKVGANVLGVVLNQVPPTDLKHYFKRYYNSYFKKEEVR